MTSHLERLKALLAQQQTPNKVYRIAGQSSLAPLNDIFGFLPVKDRINLFDHFEREYATRLSQADHSRDIKYNGLAHERVMLKTNLNNERASRQWRDRIELTERNIEAQYEKSKHLALGTVLANANAKADEIRNATVALNHREASTEEQRLKRMSEKDLLIELLKKK